MWYLEAYDRDSEMQIRDHAMPGLTTEILQNLLGLGHTVEIGGMEYPLEAGGYDIPPAILPSLVVYVEGAFEFDDSLDYQVGFYEE